MKLLVILPVLLTALYCLLPTTVVAQYDGGPLIPPPSMAQVLGVSGMTALDGGSTGTSSPTTSRAPSPPPMKVTSWAAPVMTTSAGGTLITILLGLLLCVMR